MNKFRFHTFRWNDNVLLKLREKIRDSTAWEWTDGLWCEAYEESPIRLLIIRNWNFSARSYCEQVLEILNRWSGFNPNTIIYPRAYRCIDRDFWIIYNWPETVTLAYLLENHATLPTILVGEIIRSILGFLKTWQETKNLYFQYHGYLFPDTIFIEPGAQIRIGPPVCNLQWEDAFQTILPFIPESAPLYRNPENRKGIKGDLFSLGVLAYRSITGQWPWVTLPNYGPIRSLREPLRAVMPWVSPCKVDAIEKLLAKKSDDLTTAISSWDEAFPPVKPSTTRWLDIVDLLEKEKSDTRERVYQRFLQCVQASRPETAYFWALVYRELVPPKEISDSMYRAINELRAFLPVSSDSNTPLPKFDTLEKLPHDLEQYPALLFPVWHQAMTSSFANRNILESYRYYLRLKQNRATMVGHAASFLANLEKELYAETDIRWPITLENLTHKPSLEPKEQPHSSTPLRKLRLISLLILTLGLIAGWILFQKNTEGSYLPPKTFESNDIPDLGTNLFNACSNKDRNQIKELKIDLQKAIEHKNWVKACDIKILILSCTDPGSPGFLEATKETENLCKKSYSPAK